MMSDLGLKVLFSNAVSEEVRLFVDSELKIDVLDYVSSNDQLVFLSTAPVVKILVEFTGFITLAFTSGFAGKAGSDAWGVLKERLKRVSERHRGDLELHLLESQGTSEVRYVIPTDFGEAQFAIESLESDLANLTAKDERERWWLESPMSRWGTALEFIEYRNAQNGKIK